MKSNTGKFAQRELEILVKSNTDPENRPIIEDFIPEILALVDKFGKSGQSGGSAPYTATALSQAIKKLCLQEPICEVTGLDEEWVDVTQLSDDETLFQNRRCSALFKTSKEGRAYYLDAVVWKAPNGMTWTGSALDKNGNKVYSRQFVKFPFTPKTFYIDVDEVEIKPDDWEFYIKNEAQFNKIYKYYDRA